MSDPSRTTSLIHSLGDDSSSVSLTASKSRSPRRSSNLLLKLGIILSILILALGLLGVFFVYSPAKSLLASVRQLEATAKTIMPAVESQDIQAVNARLAAVKTDLDQVKIKFNAFSWAKPLPVAGIYFSDGIHGLAAADRMLAAAEITIKAITPYADVIGLKGASGSAGGKTAQDRVNFVINTLDKVRPQLSQIGAELAAAGQELNHLDPARYPEEFRGIKVRSQLSSGILMLDQASALVNQAGPLLEQAPYILGISSPRKYLLIFQNDAELRPTGGFMTAYAVITVDKGKVTVSQSDDIYSLDAKFTKKVAAPEAILKYLPKVPYWYIRDQNLSPDFKASMEVFYPNYRSTGMPAVDGVLAIDTQVLVELLKITGTVGVSGYGNFSPDIDKRCNCPQVFYALENYADVEGPVVWDSGTGKIIYQPANYGQRKSFIGPLMYSVMANVLGQPKGKMPELFNTGIRMIQEKHIQFYYPDPKIQTAIESFNMGGRIREYQGDYLMVVDTNFAGAKTNTWVTYSADIKYEISSDGSVTKTLALTYKNPQSYFEDPTTKLKLNGIFRDWLRVYVPSGSQLIEAQGFETGQAVSTDLGKTVFEGFFTLAPTNTKKITLKYKLPAKVTSPFNVLIQKQGGTKDFPYTLSVNGKVLPEILLTSDKEISLTY